MKKMIFIPLVILFSTVFAQKEWNVLSLKGPELLHSYLINQMYDDVHVREQAWNKALTNQTELKKYQADIKARYLKILGDFPKETALNAEITGTIPCDGYSIQKIIYESFPGHHVTANLYLPTLKGKHPAAVLFCGHENTSKATESYQKTAILFVQNGFVVLVIDPISQSERHQLTNAEGKQLTRGSTTEHTLMNEGSLLVGSNTPTDILWDNKRGVDYLLSRPEVDLDKIGCLGNSGGGMQTLYYMAFDERIKVAAPCSFFSIRYRSFEINNPDDGCQQMPNEGKNRLDLVDYMTIFAPKPAIVLAGRHDFIYFQGTKDGAAQMQQVYDKFGASDNFRFFVADDGHGISKPKREAVVEFFLKKMCGISKKIMEPESQPVQTESALFCSHSGSVNVDFSNEITIPKRNLQLYEQFAQNRTAFWKQSKNEIQKKIKILLGIDYDEKIEIEKGEDIKRNNYSIQKIIIHSEGQTPLPCLFFKPDKPKEHAKYILFADEKGKNKAVFIGGKLDSLASNGQYVLAIDPRGIGETADNELENDKKFQNIEYRNAVLGLHNGKPLIGQRVVDFKMALDFLDNELTLKNNVCLIANGILGPAALHAAFLDNRISELEITREYTSWKQFLDNPLELNQMSQVIPGVLKYYDLPDLEKDLKGSVLIIKK